MGQESSWLQSSAYLQFCCVDEKGLSSWAKEREWATKGIMLAEVSWSTGGSTLTSGWNSSAMPGGISQQGFFYCGGRASEEAEISRVLKCLQGWCRWRTNVPAPCRSQMLSSAA